jgi:hypothetical protein
MKLLHDPNQSFCFQGSIAVKDNCRREGKGDDLQNSQACTLAFLHKPNLRRDHDNLHDLLHLSRWKRSAA